MPLHHLQTPAALSPELAKIAADLAAAGEKTMASEAWATAVRHGGARAAQAFIGRGGWQTGDGAFDHALTQLVRLEEGDEGPVNALIAVAKGEALTAWTMRRDHARSMRGLLAAACASNAEADQGLGVAA